MTAAVLLLVGLSVVGAMLFDVFHTVVVPRPSPLRGTIRLSPYLTKAIWPLWRQRGLRMHSEERRERFLASFAPVSLVALLVVWLCGLVLGFGLALYGLRHELAPAPVGFVGSLYLAATSLLTIGFGDVVAAHTAARVLTIAAGAAGLGVVASVITLLFTLYGSFERREVGVLVLDARAGSPPSGVQLLVTHAEHDMMGSLPDLFATWETWSAEVLDSHLAYPILAWFRSSHRGESWPSALGAVLDASSLLIAAVDEVSTGPAVMVHRTGVHLVLDLAHYLRVGFDPAVEIEQFEFEGALARLRAAGLTTRPVEEAWPRFVHLRSRYAGALNSMARYWATPPAEWIGDRSPLPTASRPHTF